MQSTNILNALNYSWKEKETIQMYQDSSLCIPNGRGQQLSS